MALATPSAGLVIRKSSIELLAMQGSKVTARVRVAVPGPERQHLVQALRQAFALANVKSNRVAIAVPTADVLVRFFSMPLLPRGEWETAVQFEARRYVPFKTENLVWDYHAIESRATKKLDVIFTAIQRAALQAIQEALAEAGIQAASLEPRSVSLARLAVLPKGRAVNPNEYLLLVDLEGNDAHLVIAKQGIPYLTRDLILADASGQPEPASVPPGPAQAEEPALSAPAQRLLSELRVSMDFFMREHPEAIIPKVVLFGDDAHIAGLLQVLTDQLRCAVETGRTLLAQWVEGDLPLSFASAVGLLRKGQVRAEPPLDFLKRITVKATQGRAATPALMESLGRVIERIRVGPLIGIGGAAAGVLLLVWVLGWPRVAAQQHRLQERIQSRPAVGWGLEAKDHAAIQPILETARQQLGALTRIVDQRVSVAARLDALARALPDGVWLTGLTFDERLDPSQGRAPVTLKVSGACYLEEQGKEMGAIQELESRIKSNPNLFAGFGAVRVEQIQQQIQRRREAQYTYRTFQLNCVQERKL